MRVKVLKAIRNNTPGVKAYVQAIKAGKSRNQHVTPTEDSGWQVKDANAEKAIKKFKTQAEAVEFARQVAIDSQTELFKYDKKGEKRGKKLHFPPRG